MKESPEKRFSHLDASGRAAMVDVSAKAATRRIAEASCRVVLDAATIEQLESLPKGDALVLARVAGIQAAKRTGDLIPLAHGLEPEHVAVDIKPDEKGVLILSRVVVTAKTGVEMEALTACAAAALTLYDMVKAVDRHAAITDLRLEAKSGGRSGSFERR